jgi:hypothetical protein
VTSDTTPPEAGDTCRLFLLCAYLPLSTIEAVLRGIETIVFKAAYQQLAVADIPTVTATRPAACYCIHFAYTRSR